MTMARARSPHLAKISRYWEWYVGVAKRYRTLRLSRRRWLKEPSDLSGSVCLLACFVDGKAIPEQTVYLARGWHRAGFKVILVAATDRFDPARSSLSWQEDGRLAFLEGVLERENCGYDFGSWSIVLRLLGKLPRTELLALSNDSVLGPFGSFDATIGRIRNEPADVVGLTESFELQRHIQSYAMFFKPLAFESRAFRRFWRLRRASDREQAIVESEIVLRERLQAAGLTVTSLHSGSAESRRNPMLCNWRELLDAGFPFIKIRLIRERVLRGERDDWPTLLAGHGYPQALTESVLAGMKFPSEARS